MTLTSTSPIVVAAAAQAADNVSTDWDALADALKQQATPGQRIVVTIQMNPAWMTPYLIEKLDWDDDNCYRHILAMQRRAIVHDDPGCLDSADFAADVLRMRGHDVEDVYA